jgi:hypothetical protein
MDTYVLGALALIGAWFWFTRPSPQAETLEPVGKSRVEELTDVLPRVSDPAVRGVLF